MILPRTIWPSRGQKGGNHWSGRQRCLCIWFTAHCTCIYYITSDNTNIYMYQAIQISIFKIYKHCELIIHPVLLPDFQNNIFWLEFMNFMSPTEPAEILPMDSGSLSPVSSPLVKKSSCWYRALAPLGDGFCSPESSSRVWNLSPLTTKNRPRGWNLTPKRRV